MLTSTDKKWIEEKFIKELKPVRDSVDLLRGKIGTIHFEKFNLDSRLDSIEASNIRTEEKIDKLIAIADGNAGNIADLSTREQNGFHHIAPIRYSN